MATFDQVLAEYRPLPPGFTEDMILKAPSPDVMNKLGRSVLALYSYDPDPENKALEAQLEEAKSESAGLDSYTMGYLEARERMGKPYYVASVNSDIFHRSSCDYVDSILEENRTYYLSKLRAIIDGKQPCSVCMPGG